MHIFITGGSKGIGHGMALEFCKRGHKVSFTGTSEHSIQEGLNKITGEVKAYVLDVRHKSQIELVLNKALETYGPIDIWINNAGVNQLSASVSDLPEEEIKRIVDINITGMILGTSVALTQMKKQGFGKVYNMEGLGSNNMKIAHTLVYGGSKRFLTYFSQGCNKELKEYPTIFVGTLQPGMVFTNLLLNQMSDDGMKIAKILGSKVEVVTPFLVKQMLKGKQTIKYLTFRKTMWRFMSAPFSKRNSEY